MEYRTTVWIWYEGSPTSSQDYCGSSSYGLDDSMNGGYNVGGFLGGGVSESCEIL